MALGGTIEYILGDRKMSQWFQIQIAGDVPGAPADVLVLVRGFRWLIQNGRWSVDWWIEFWRMPVVLNIPRAIEG